MEAAKDGQRSSVSPSHRRTKYDLLLTLIVQFVMKVLAVWHFDVSDMIDRGIKHAAIGPSLAYEKAKCLRGCMAKQSAYLTSTYSLFAQPMGTHHARCILVLANPRTTLNPLSIYSQQESMPTCRYPCVDSISSFSKRLATIGGGRRLYRP